jgi:hypothetical protein
MTPALCSPIKVITTPTVRLDLKTDREVLAIAKLASYLLARRRLG